MKRFPRLGLPAKMRRLHILQLLLCVSLVGCIAPVQFSPLKPLERSLVYHPRPLSEDLGLNDLPGLESVTYEDAHFESSDGTKLHGWFIGHPNPVAIALFLHGNGGNISDVAQSLVLLNERHSLSVLTFDYRGYGRSEGKPDEIGILADARSARRWLADRTGVRESDIVVLGHSMGGGVAVDLAAEDGARGLVLSNTFTSLPDVGNHHLRFIPTRLMMTQRLDSISKIAKYHGPLLQSHGDADKVVPYKLANNYLTPRMNQRRL